MRSMQAIAIVMILGIMAVKASQAERQITIQMPGAKPKGTDSYLCTAFDLSKRLNSSADPIYVTRYTPVNAASERVHHMLLYGCSHPPQAEGQIWDCRHHQTCRGQTKILFAWAKNAPRLQLPDDVAFEIGSQDPGYLVLQVHYVNGLDEPDDTGLSLSYQKEPALHFAGIILMVNSFLLIPPGKEKVHGDVNCKIKSDSDLNMFAYRTHAHSLGTVISGYKYSPKTEEFVEIAKGNPQWPQAFYPMNETFVVKKGEYLAARCTYDSTNKTKLTRIGATSGDEMCNLYIMYYKSKGKSDFKICSDQESFSLNSKLPPDSDVPLPPNPLLEEHALHSKPKSIKKGDLEHDQEQAKGKETNEGKRRQKGDLDNPLSGTDPEVIPSSLTIQMPGAEPKMDDEYFCTAFNISKLTNGSTIYVTEFVARATALKAHHLILSKCRKPHKEEGEIWNCRHHAECQSGSKIMFAWAKDAPPTQMPPDVAFQVDPSDGYIVLQVHYAHELPEKDYTGLTLTYQEEEPKYLAGIYLFLRSFLRIPPHTEKVHGNMNCQINSPITLFAFRTHAHSLGSVITGYAIHDGKWREVARGDPQKPQTFYPMKNFEEIKSGDFIAARCTYNSSTSDKTVQIGATAGDEMCNLYFMYYTPSDEHDKDMLICMDEQVYSLSKNFPDDSDTLKSSISNELPISYTNEDQNEVDTGGLIPNKAKKQGVYIPQQPYQIPLQPMPPQSYQPNPNNIAYGYPNIFPPVQSYPQQNYPPQQIPFQTGVSGNGGGNYNNLQNFGDGFIANEGDLQIKTEPATTEATPTTRSKVRTWQTQPPLAGIAGKNDNRKGKQLGSGSSNLYPVPGWPPKATADILGQISGVAIDSYGNPVIFHRGDRIWDAKTFKRNNEFNLDRTKPIPVDTVLTLNASGHIVNSWGRNKFFMPHMITIDSKNNIWITDVALHQVFKFLPYGGRDQNYEPIFTMGKRFEPGSDDDHFCKPTSVAVSANNKDFFVSDGYCNSRIIKYTQEVLPNGKHKVTKLFSWGEADGSGISISVSPNAFNIPHSLALAEDKDLVCVADRENMRITCFRASDGKFVKVLQPDGIGRPYSISYSSAKGGLIFAVNGNEPFGALSGIKSEGLIIDINSGLLNGTFDGNPGFENPHDVQVSQDGNTAYVVELKPFRLWKLTNGQSSLPSFPAVPNDLLNNDDNGKIGLPDMKNLSKIVPSSTFGVAFAVGSLLLTFCVSICLACRRCKKRGKGTMTSRANGTKKSGRDHGGGKKKLDLGDILGRSKEGFQRLKTEEDDEIGSNLSSDSDDELDENFSVPALRA